MSWAVVVAAIPALLAGCNRLRPDALEKKWGEPGYDDDQVVLMQLCLPARRIRFDTLRVDRSALDAARREGRVFNTPDWTPEQLAAADTSVRVALLSDAADGVRWRNMPSDVTTNHDGIVGNGPSGLALFSSTGLDQPVFQASGDYPRHYVAIHVRSMPAGGQQGQAPQWWFAVPADVGLAWTAWRLPQAETDGARDAQIGWKVLQDRAITPSTVRAPGAPRMRFRLVTRRESAAAELRWRPAYTAAFFQLLPQPTPPQWLPEIVPQAGAAIPGC